MEMEEMATRQRGMLSQLREQLTHFVHYKCQYNSSKGVCSWYWMFVPPSHHSIIGKKKATTPSVVNCIP